MDACKPLVAGDLEEGSVRGGAADDLEARGAGGRGVGGDRTSSGGKVGRCRFTVSKPVLTAPMVSGLEATI